MTKEPGKRIPRSFLEETRFRALEAIDRGCHPEDVAPVGCTPVVHGTGNRKTVTMMSAVSARGKPHFSLLADSVDSAVFIEFCEKLLHDVDGKIFLVVDGHRSHTSKATRKYVESAGGRLRLFYLPRTLRS